MNPETANEKTEESEYVAVFVGFGNRLSGNLVRGLKYKCRGEPDKM